MSTTTLNRKIITVEPDDLVAGTTPPTRIGSAVIRKGAAAVSLKRGTVMAKSSVDAKLVVLGSDAADKEALEAYGILTDNIEVGTDEDHTAEIYIGGKFNSNKITVADGYTMSETDKDTLRKYGIEFTAALKY